MQYAVNTPNKVIQVGTEYYLCYQGVWFVSFSAQGPWQVAQTVPQVIYTIPPSSPVYNVTYVTQVPASDGTVTASYTAGYMGAFIMGAAVGAIVASGTGYYYPPYVYGGYYYPYAATYGYHTYNPYTGAYGVRRRGIRALRQRALGNVLQPEYRNLRSRGNSVYCLRQPQRR